MNLIILRILGLGHFIAVNVNIASACYFAALSFCLERLGSIWSKLLLHVFKDTWSHPFNKKSAKKNDRSHSRAS